MMHPTNHRRRTRPLELFEHECIDLERPLDVELLLDEHEYRLKWPNAPLSKFLNRHAQQQQQQQQQQNRMAQRAGSGNTPTTASGSVTRHSQPDYVVVPHVFVVDHAPRDGQFEAHGRDMGEDSEGDEGRRRRRTRRESTPGDENPRGGYFSCGPVFPPAERWDGEPYDLLVFSDEQINQLSQAGFPEAFALHPTDAVESGNEADHEYRRAALWGEASVIVTELELAAHHEHMSKTLRVLRLLSLSHAVPAAVLRPSWSKGPSWLGSLRWKGVEILHEHWLRWRSMTSNPSRPWGSSLLPRLHVSLPSDDFFLSQEAVGAISTSADRTSPQVLLSERRRNGVMPDFNLRLKRERREGACKAAFGYLPFDMRSSSAWSHQEPLWSMVVVGRRSVGMKELVDLVSGLPHPKLIPLMSLNPGGTSSRKDSAAAGYAAAETMLSQELDDARRLLSF
jgi:hypothetical protein